MAEISRASALLMFVAHLLRIEPGRLSRILTISVPIIGGMLSQSVINLVDAAMVGRLGDDALAGVGIGAYATFITVSVVMGLSAGVQAMVARRYGAQQFDTLQEPLLAGLRLAIYIGLPLSLFFWFAAPWIIPLFNKDQAVIDIAVPYFEWRTLATIAVGMNFVFRGFWNGIGEGKTYLQTLLIMHLVNIVVSYVLIYGMGSWAGFGAVGSGIGTTIAMIFGCLLYYWQTFHRFRDRFAEVSQVSRDTMNKIVRLTLPNSTQQTLFALGNSVLFWIIGQVGTQEQAIGHILINLALLMILPAVGLGMAATSLVGHALGRGDTDDAYRSGWEVVRVAMLLMALFGLPLWLFPESILRLFTPHEHLIALGSTPLRITGFSIVFEVTAMVLTQALLGAGASRQVMRINLLMQWSVLLPLAFVMGPVAGFGLLGIWLLQALQRITLSLIYGVIWKRRHWSRIAL
ncbi:MATE family efflux transporter [Thalassolituus sp. LLYu03]|uniref:MATE family efflux transporter n=1 Tax=Thalassolituus sp. LLYu03 TaxID=3421656 RepID=UPI003D2AB59C